jgi:hypothetical protein
MKKKKILYSFTASCVVCGTNKSYMGEDEQGDLKQAKINARVNAAEDGWFIHYLNDSNLCPTCKILPEGLPFLP